MGTIWIKELTGGLDTRRMPETTPGGVLIKATDGHITRGGEFEKRAAFVPAYSLPADATVGLAHMRSGLVVFGHATAPTDLPTGVSYQQLVHPDDATLAISRILSYDLNAGLIYVVAEFADGSIQHYYNGSLVTDWFDGRARGSFTVSGDGGDSLDNLTVEGVAIISAPVNWTTDNATTAAAIATAINSHTSSPDYTATAVGEQVNIAAALNGAAANGRLVIATVTGLVLDPATGLTLSGGGGEAVAAVAARGKFKVVATAVNRLAALKVSGGGVSGTEIVDIMDPVTFRTDATATAAAIVTAINNYSSFPEYTAVNAGPIVTVTAPVGTAANHRTMSFSVTGDFTVSGATEFSGGTASVGATASFTVSGGTPSVVTDINVSGVAILGSTVIYDESTTATAAAIAAAINDTASTPAYTATSAGAWVTVWAAASEGADANGRTITSTSTGGVSISSASVFANGVSAVNVYLPGTYVRTIDSKVYSVAHGNLHFSGIKQPTKWTTATVGAGFIDMASERSGAEELKAVATYQEFIAIFAENLTLIWYVDPDPTLNRKAQILTNTGTGCPRSVTEFGDNDVYYLHESGLRSLQARDSSNAASTTDIGVPVDSLITAKLRLLSETERDQVIGLINPSDGRFWLIMRDEIFVFSYYTNAKISAWSTYLPGYEDENGVIVPFIVDEAIVHNRKVWLRAGDTIYVYGGDGDEETTDETQAIAWLPYFDAGHPTADKSWSGIDAAVEGEWRVDAAMDPTNLDAYELIGTISKTTYNLGRVETAHKSTHFSMRFTSQGSGRAKLSAAVIHHRGNLAATED